ncbi:MAG: transglutaminaseTgpA domain-containing protein [Propionibacteriaceae bacterium]|nr:transglutaminaseTgpA domain-containing protein [Propionibacteriaceae bacterium]
MRQTWINVLVVAVLLLIAGATHGPVFGDARGYLAVLGGVLIGGGVALVAALRRWGWGLTVMVAALAYLLLGGAFAFPELNTAVVVPSVSTLQLLVVQVVFGWRDNLTIAPPLRSFPGAAVLPLFSALVCSLVAVTLAARTKKRQASALLPVAVLGVTGVLWGSQVAPFAAAIGAAGVAIAVAWAAWLASSRRRRGASGILAVETHRVGPRRLVAVVSLLTAVAVGLGLAWLVPAGHRDVLRDHVTPPLEVEEYHSPLSYFRHYVVDKKTEKLFTVDQLNRGYRVRLAALDAYDGTVFRVASATAGEGFRRIGEATTEDPSLPESAVRLGITINQYTGHWVPGGGDVRRIEFGSQRAAALKADQFYSESHRSLFNKTPLAEGDAYSVTVVPEGTWSDEDLAAQPFAQVPMPHDEFVPEIVAQRASELTAEADTPIAQIRAIEQHLHTSGFFSNGEDNLSRAGHRAERIRTLLESAQMIGDDEQYAVAMALMVRQLGIPARVVLGFYPEATQSGEVALTGDDVHAWVEVAFSKAGWVAFNPTPPRDKKPQTQVEKPRVQPRPQVLQPPPPPVEPAELPPEFLDEDADSDEQNDRAWLGYLLLAAQVAGGALLLASPFLAILVAKGLRRRRRRTRGDELAKVAGAWQEVVDQARDLRTEVPLAAATRRQQAAALDRALNQDADADEFGFRPATPGSVMAFAQAVDRSIFGSACPAPGLAGQAWSGADDIRRQLRGATGRFRRIAALASVRSLRRPRTGPKGPGAVRKGELND